MPKIAALLFVLLTSLYLASSERFSSKEIPEVVTDADLASRSEQMQILINTGLTFTHGEESWTYTAQEKDFAFSKTDGVLHMTLTSDFFTFLTSSLASEIQKETGNLTLLSADPSAISKVEMEGQISEGRTLLLPLLKAMIHVAIQNGDNQIEVPVAYESGKVINQTGLDLGPLEEIGEGKSTFWGSSPEREFNIRKALNEKFNGILIPPGAEFSYVEWLGPIEWGGWKQAYTIFNGTQLEKAPAGGVCQVSTTVYRAVLDAALQITEHRTHSLYVIYYNEYGDGLDATIFPGEQDFKFVNNTENYLLMTATEEGYYEAVIRFYGEDDGRETTLIGPYTTSNPTEESTAAVGNLGIGEIAWKYLITHADGTESIEWIRSTYLSKATQYKVDPSELDTDALPIKTGP